MEPIQWCREIFGFFLCCFHSCSEFNYICSFRKGTCLEIYLKHTHSCLPMLCYHSQICEPRLSNLRMRKTTCHGDGVYITSRFTKELTPKGKYRLIGKFSLDLFLHKLFHKAKNRMETLSSVTVCIEKDFQVFRKYS